MSGWLWMAKNAREIFHMILLSRLSRIHTHDVTWRKQLGNIQCARNPRAKFIQFCSLSTNRMVSDRMIFRSLAERIPAMMTITTAMSATMILQIPIFFSLLLWSSETDRLPSMIMRIRIIVMCVKQFTMTDATASPPPPLPASPKRGDKPSSNLNGKS